jgi:hypothetical protein
MSRKLVQNCFIPFLDPKFCSLVCSASEFIAIIYPDTSLTARHHLMIRSLRHIHKVTGFFPHYEFGAKATIPEISIQDSSACLPKIWLTPPDISDKKYNLHVSGADDYVSWNKRIIHSISAGITERATPNERPSFIDGKKILKFILGIGSGS